MSLMTQEGITAALGREIDPAILVVAKLAVGRMDSDEISGVLGTPISEIHELIESQDYKDVRMLVGVEHARLQTAKDFTWDEIESVALEGIARKIANIRDPEELLRYAAVANKAVRRLPKKEDHVMDPANAQTRVPLKLTRRFTEKLNNSGEVVERTEIQQISVVDGSAKTPSFDKISESFGLGKLQESSPVVINARDPSDELERFLSTMPDA